MRAIYFVVLFFLILFLSEGYSAVKAGKVMEVSGKRDQLRLDRIDKKLPLRLDDPLFFKDTVLTGDASTAGLHLTPESDSEVKLFVYENSELKIEPDLLKVGKRHFVAKFNRGLMRFLAKGLKKNNEELQLNLPNCVVGVRGTEGEIVVGLAGQNLEAWGRFAETEGKQALAWFAELWLKDGEASITINPDTPKEQTVVVGAGVTATVTGTAGSATITTGVGAPTVADTQTDGGEGRRFQDDRRASFYYFDILKSRLAEIPPGSTQALDMSRRNTNTRAHCYCPDVCSAPPFMVCVDTDS